MKYGYMRVSTEMQETDRQGLILEEMGIPQQNIFQEKISGTVSASRRQQFEELLKVIRENDTIYFESLSRLGRSTIDLIDTVNLLTKRYKVNLVFIKENLNLSVDGSGLDAVGTLFFTIMAAMAQFERDLLSQRTKEGLQAKKKNGIRLGRPEALDDEQFLKFYSDWKSKIGYEALMSKYDISRGTVATLVKKCKEYRYSEDC